MLEQSAISFLMDSNARRHRARAVHDYLESESTECMDWPARSPDLTLIKHIWNELQVRIIARQLQFITIQEHGVKFVQE
jgi:hypothetical protein